MDRVKPILPVLLKDGYKVGHINQYPAGTTLIYSNLTPRKSRIEDQDKLVVFGVQYLIKEYLVDQFNHFFFERPRKYVVDTYKRRIDNYLGKDAISAEHIGELHKLGYLPLMIKALPEGTLAPMRVPILTIRNTREEFYWLTNMLETLISCVVWPMCTSATTAFRYRKAFEHWAKVTGAAREFVPWQGHDFSFRGMMGTEAAIMSGMAHLTCFAGTDTIPAIDGVEMYYEADSDTELVAGSVPATEHSVMSMGLKDGELSTFRRLIKEVYPKGIVSIVSDTFDFWKVITEYLPALKEEILARNGKVVIRPDSGDPVKIICGDPDGKTEWERKGAIQCLFEVFGGTVNKSGFKELDPHIGLIYGDSITPERQQCILAGLAAKGFASSNVVLGIGSYTYQYVTRDTYGMAMKATYGEIYGIGRDIFKDPATDDGTKKSAKGLLYVEKDKETGAILLEEGVDWDLENCGLLQVVFMDGAEHNTTTLSEIRTRIEENFK